VGIMQLSAQQKQLAFVYQPAPNLPALIEADEKRLRQVLLNLLSNAVKFTERGQVTLRVAWRDNRPTTNDQRPTADDISSFVIRRSSLVVEVEDTGVGIAPDQIERIFQPFEQAGDASQRAAGSGLGLAIS